MKKILFTTAVLLSTLGFGQNNSILKEVQKNACDCIQKIDESDLMSRKHFYDEIKKCIDAQVLIYQTSDLLNNLDLTQKKSDEKTEVKIYSNPESEEYKKYYYQLEEVLLNECEGLKDKISASEIGMENDLHSQTKNKTAIKAYDNGINAVRKGDTELAVKEFKKAVEADPKFVYAWDNLGVNLRRLNRFDEAIKAYETSLSINPYGNMPLQNIAIVYIYSKKFDKAEEAYKKYLSIYPEGVKAIYGLANLYLSHLDKKEEGLDYACKAYIMYSQAASPYRSDAQQLIKIAYQKFSDKNEVEKFNEILNKHNLQ